MFTVETIIEIRIKFLFIDDKICLYVFKLIEIKWSEWEKQLLKGITKKKLVEKLHFFLH